MVEELTRDELLAHLRERDAQLPTFTDEELEVVAPSPAGDRFVPSPRVDALDPDVRDRVLRTALRSLVARGYAGPPADADSGGVEVRGALAVIVHLRRGPSSLATVGSSGSGRWYLYVAADRDTVLVETVTNGYHRFVLRSLDRTVRGLSAVAGRTRLEVVHRELGEDPVRVVVEWLAAASGIDVDVGGRTFAVTREDLDGLLFEILDPSDAMIVNGPGG